jgi:hypothetical protein
MSDVGKAVQYTALSLGPGGTPVVEAGIVVADDPVVLAVIDAEDGSITIVNGAVQDDTQTSQNSYAFV